MGAETLTFQRDSQNLSTRLRVFAGTKVVFVTGLLYSILLASGCTHHNLLLLGPVRSFCRVLVQDEHCWWCCA